MAKGGKRPGAGRPKGSLTKVTIEKRKTEEAMTLRILGAVDRLINSQLTLAEGTSFLPLEAGSNNGEDLHATGGSRADSPLG